MVHQQEDKNSGQMSTNPSFTTVETDTQTPAAAKHVEEKEVSSSSSTSSEDIDGDDFFQIEGPALGSQFSLGARAEGGSEDARMADIKQQNSSSLLTESHATTDPKQSPPVQAMSRASDECPDPKRIPSSVFARSKSTTPTEWSVTSNESLFSINVGNASFSKDHLFLYGKSGELGKLNDPLAPLPPLPRQSPGSSPIEGEVAPKTTGQASAKVKPAAPKEKGGGHGLEDRDGDENTDYIHSLSHRSDGSTTSFAFPILAGDVRSSGSLKDNHPEFARQSTAQMTQPVEPHVEKKETLKVAMEAPKAEEAPAPAPPPAPPATTKWFPLCSCCPFCC